MIKRFAVMLLSPLVIGSAFAASRDPVPRFDVEHSCRDAQAISAAGTPRGRNTTSASGGQTDTYHACMQDEQQAHDQLTKKWGSFRTGRQSCVEAVARPSPSYVELLTCLEMNDPASIPKADSGEAVAPIAGGRAGRGGSPSPRPIGSPAPGGSAK